MTQLPFSHLLSAMAPSASISASYSSPMRCCYRIPTLNPNGPGPFAGVIDECQPPPLPLKASCFSPVNLHLASLLHTCAFVCVFLPTKALDGCTDGWPGLQRQQIPLELLRLFYCTGHVHVSMCIYRLKLSLCTGATLTLFSSLCFCPCAARTEAFPKQPGLIYNTAHVYTVHIVYVRHCHTLQEVVSDVWQPFECYSLITFMGLSGKEETLWGFY